MRTIVSLIVVILATGQSATATASPDAEVLYVEGQEAYDRADYATAIQRWRRSHEISGEIGLLFNLAQALRLSGDCAAALKTYRRFIEADPDPASEQHGLATDLTRELETACRSTLTSDADPPAPGTNAPPHDHVDQGQRPGHALRTTGLVTSGAGALLLVTGLIVGQHARSLGDDVTTACAVTCDWNEQQSKEAAGRRYTIVGYALDAVGVVAIAGGAIMYYIGARQNVAVAPPLNARGAVVSWSRSW